MVSPVPVVQSRSKKRAKWLVWIVAVPVLIGLYLYKHKASEEEKQEGQRGGAPPPARSRTARPSTLQRVTSLSTLALPEHLCDIAPRVHLIWLDHVPSAWQDILRSVFPHTTFVNNTPRLFGTVDVWIDGRVKPEASSSGEQPPSVEYLRPGGYWCTIAPHAVPFRELTPCTPTVPGTSSVFWYRRNGCRQQRRDCTYLHLVPNSCVLINYATKSHSALQEKNSAWARDEFGADAVISFGPEDVDTEFQQRYAHILSLPRGGGYWMWKPLVIYNALQTCNAEMVIYCDSSTKLAVSREQFQRLTSFSPILAFHNRGHWFEFEWTKRDVFDAFGVHSLNDNMHDRVVTHSEQVVATVSVYNRRLQPSVPSVFAERWLQYATRDELITDAANHSGASNFPGFVEHRHDQSLFSLLCKTEFHPHVSVLPMSQHFMHHHFG